MKYADEIMIKNNNDGDPYVWELYHHGVLVGILGKSGRHYFWVYSINGKDQVQARTPKEAICRWAEPKFGTVEIVVPDETTDTSIPGYGGPFRLDGE